MYIWRKSWQLALKEGACSMHPYYKVNVASLSLSFFSFLQQEYGTLKEAVLYLEIVPCGALRAKALFEELIRRELFSSVLSLAVASICARSWKLSHHKQGPHLNHGPVIKRWLITAMGIFSTVFSWCWVLGILVLWVGEVFSPCFCAAPCFFVSQSLLSLGGKFGC